MLIGVLLGAITTFVVQAFMNSLPLGGMLGLLVMILLGAIQWNEIDEVVENGFKMMTFIAFVMLVAAGHANVLKASLTLWR